MKKQPVLHHERCEYLGFPSLHGAERRHLISVFSGRPFLTLKTTQGLIIYFFQAKHAHTFCLQENSQGKTINLIT